MTTSIECTSFIIFLASSGILLYWTTTTILQSKYYYDIALIPFASFICIFFVNSFLLNIVGIFVPAKWLHQNSIYICNYDETPPSAVYLPLTIQIPVYKESFKDVIQPTLTQALEACQNYKEEYGVDANVFVNDDGLACLSEEEQNERIAFYVANNIMYSNRPKENRRGKFKKAGNLNYGLRNHVDIVHDIILLLDCDSRIPTKRLGEAVRQFHDPRLGFLQMKTRAMLGGGTHWEYFIGYFTNTIYELSFRLTTAYGDPSPLVGHNVFLRRDALFEVATWDQDIMYFSEYHVSEDFDLSMRLQIAGYVGRYGTFLDGFEEGVTFTATDEIIRLQKYAYGVSELLMYPISEWGEKGILCPTFKAYLFSDKIPIWAKYNVIGYMGMYYALAFSPISVLFHYFGYFYISEYRTFLLTPEHILYACLFVFSILTPISMAFVKYKLGISYNFLKDFGLSILFGLFFSSLGLHTLFAILCHVWKLPMSWSTTNKESISYGDRLKNLRVFWISYTVCGACVVLCLMGWKMLGITYWNAFVPLCIMTFSHTLVPIVGIL